MILTDKQILSTADDYLSHVRTDEVLDFGRALESALLNKSIEQCREEFEKWASSQYLVLDMDNTSVGSFYSSNKTEMAWKVWKASRGL